MPAGSAALLATLALLPVPLMPQNTPITVSVGAVRTPAERGAIRIAVDVVPALSTTTVQHAYRQGLIYVSPEVRIEAGDGDTFTAFAARVTGSVLVFPVTEVDGVPTPDTRVVHAVPLSLGAEADRGFANVAALAEVGYVPWIQGRLPPSLSTLRLGVFVQGGYRALDADTTAAMRWLARAKASFSFKPEIIVTPATGFGVGLLLAGDGWYDFVERRGHRRIEAALRLRLGDGRYVDFTYQDGAGAPSFDRGNQWSTSLTVTF